MLLQEGPLLLQHLQCLLPVAIRPRLRLLFSQVAHEVQLKPNEIWLISHLLWQLNACLSVGLTNRDTGLHHRLTVRSHVNRLIGRRRAVARLHPSQEPGALHRQLGLQLIHRLGFGIPDEFLDQPQPFSHILWQVLHPCQR